LRTSTELTDETAMSTPPSAAPVTLPVCTATPVVALAASSRFTGTISRTRVVPVGTAVDSVSPRTNTVANTCHTRRCPVSDRVAVTARVSAEVVSAAANTNRRGNRSMATPMNGPNTTPGSAAVSSTSGTADGLLVSV